MHSVYQTQGKREYMEDVIDIENAFWGEWDFYAVYDGHGGDIVSKYLGTNLRPMLKKNLTLTHGDIKMSLQKTFDDIGQFLKTRDFAQYCGSTALITLKSKKEVWVANIGDCRAVLKCFHVPFYKGFPITEDHKPNLPREKDRIYEVGGFIEQDSYGTWRVKGNLAVSRSFGDIYLYPSVSWQPDIFRFDIANDMRAVIMASDGVWDTLSNQDVVNIANQVIRSNMMYDQKSILQLVCKAISDEAQARGSMDNISVIFFII